MIGHAPALRHVRVDPAKHEHLGEVMQIMTTAFDPRYGEAWTRAQCAGILPMFGVSLRLARSTNSAPLGFSLYRTIAQEAELLLLAVSPEVRRQGVGKALLDDFIDTARSQGVVLVHLEVRENNPAILMYNAAGFATVGRRQSYYKGSDGSRFDALTLSRNL